jgi:hypothetical protein
VIAALAGAVSDFIDRRRYDPVTSIHGDDLVAAGELRPNGASLTLPGEAHRPPIGR